MFSYQLLELLAKTDSKARPFITSLLPWPVSTLIYSNARKVFINRFANSNIPKIHLPPECNVKLWDIDFNCPIFNAAGMFKKAEGYYAAANMGAGAFLTGTTTATKRQGNKKQGVKHPFMPYPHSASSSNWMGLPNAGHQTTAKVISTLNKIKLCPVGASLAESPETQDETRQTQELIDGMILYEMAKVDFIELNFSCPNVTHHTTTNIQQSSTNKCSVDETTINKLTMIADKFLAKRPRNLPVIAKYSNDISHAELISIIDLLIDMKFDGINIGNTSTKYEHYLPAIHPKDIPIYQHFTTTFGGGLSGNILKENSLSLCQAAVQHIKSKKLTREFHCIRTGGIGDSNDIAASQNAGITINQWFAGFFEQFAKNGFKLYEKIMMNKK